MRITDVVFQLTILSRELRNNGNALSNNSRVKLADKIADLVEEIYQDSLDKQYKHTDGNRAGGRPGGYGK